MILCITSVSKNAMLSQQIYVNKTGFKGKITILTDLTYSNLSTEVVIPRLQCCNVLRQG